MIANNFSYSICSKFQSFSLLQSKIQEFVRKESPALDEKFVNDEDFIRRLNAAQDSWTARAYPENEK